MARRFFDKPIVSRAGLFMDTEGGVAKPLKGEGDPNIVMVTRTVKDITSSMGGQGKVYQFRAKLEYGDTYIDGELVKGVVVGWRALEPPKLLRTVDYVSGGGRLNNGFDSLMTALQLSGGDKNEILRLREIWSELSDTDKSDVWNKYRKWQEDNGYGSYPNPDVNDITEIEEYLTEIGRILDRKVSA